MEKNQCRRCKMNLTLDNFKKKRDDTYQKTCEECLAQQRAYAHSNKCEHGRRRGRCKECSDPVKITIESMIKHSKEKDKKYNRYDPVNFIDYCFAENLLDDYKHCYYEDCGCELQLIKFQDNLATIERLDNNIGHVKSNCVICCLKCNNAKKSNVINS
jgi:hypothetical protein